MTVNNSRSKGLYVFTDSASVTGGLSMIDLIPYYWRVLFYKIQAIIKISPFIMYKNFQDTLPPEIVTKIIFYPFYPYIFTTPVKSNPRIKLEFPTLVY